jgi:acyl-CoA dehydrogenase
VASLLERGQVVADLASRHADDVDRTGRFPHEAISAMRETGLLGVCIPSELGGEGAGPSEIVRLCHKLGQACGSTGMIYAMHQTVVASVAAHGVDSEWHRAFLRETALRQLLVASSDSEQGIGGAIGRSHSAIESEGARFRLVKDASVISFGREADAILVSTRRSPASPPGDQVSVLVTRDDYDLEEVSGWDTLGMRATRSAAFRLRAAGWTKQILPEDRTEIYVRSINPLSHLTWGAVWLGIATSAVARAHAYVQGECRKSNSLDHHSARRLAQIVEQLQVMKASLLTGLADYERALRSPDELFTTAFAVTINNIKTGISDLAFRIVSGALSVCGLAGYKNNSEFSLGRHLRDVSSASLMISNDRIHASTAKLLLNCELSPELSL